jgi:DNA polymerase-4
MFTALNMLGGVDWSLPARRWVAHVDMDAFFASVEQLDDPALAGLPVIVGNSPLSMSRLRELAEEAASLSRPPELIKGVRGVVASASYAARAYGVRSAMPLARALSLCPQLVILPGRFKRYREVATRLREVWGEFSPVVEPMSLDEAYLDLTGSELCDGPIRATGERLKKRIREETGLTASVGLASSKLVAKVASDLKKPDGLVVVEHGEEATLLAPMPVRTLPGVGPRTAEVLSDLGITTLGELASYPASRLVQRFGHEQAASLQARAAGIDPSPVELPGDPKSISKETTLAEDTRELPTLETILWELSDGVTWNLRCEGFRARCVFLKLRLLPTRRAWSPDGGGFGRLITRRVTLDAPTGSARVVGATARDLLRRAYAGTGLRSGAETVRLIGVGVTSLVHEVDVALSSFAPSTQDREQKLDAGIDRIRAKYGFGAISFGTSARSPHLMDDEGDS